MVTKTELVKNSVYLEDKLIVLLLSIRKKSGYVHDNRGHIPSEALDKSISENIILLYMNKYYDFNFNHFKNFKKRKGPIIANIEILIKWDFSGIEVKKL